MSISQCSTASTSWPRTTRSDLYFPLYNREKGDDHPGHRPSLFPFFSFMPMLSSITRCHRVHLPTKNHQKIPIDYQPLNANAYFLPCNCMFLKCICNALAYAKVFQMSSFSKFTVPFMQMHVFLMQLHCKCITQKCNCIANAFFGQRKENFPPHPLYKEKKKIKKRKLKKERFLHQEAGEPGAVTKPKGLGRAREAFCMFCKMVL